MIQGVIFDADGTLLSSMPVWKDLGARYLSGLGLEPEPGLNEITAAMTMEESSAYFKSHYGLPQSPDEIKAGFLSIIADFYQNEIQYKTGLPDFLESLARHRIPMIIVTSGDKELIVSALKRLKLSHYFKGIISCTDLGTSKREPYIYQAAAKYLNGSYEQIYVFDDALYSLMAAGEAGFKTIGVEDPSSEEDKEEITNYADYYMTDFSDFQRFWRFAIK